PWRASKVSTDKKDLQIHEVRLRRTGQDKIAGTSQQIPRVVRMKVQQRDKALFGRTRAGPRIDDPTRGICRTVGAVGSDTRKTTGTGSAACHGNPQAQRHFLIPPADSVPSNCNRGLPRCKNTSGPGSGISRLRNLSTDGRKESADVFGFAFHFSS